MTKVMWLIETNGYLMKNIAVRWFLTKDLTKLETSQICWNVFLLFDVRVTIKILTCIKIQTVWERHGPSSSPKHNISKHNKQYWLWSLHITLAYIIKAKICFQIVPCMNQLNYYVMKISVYHLDRWYIEMMIRMMIIFLRICFSIVSCIYFNHCVWIHFLIKTKSE